MLAAKIAIVLAALSLVSVVTATDCKQANGFKKSKCGKGDSVTCCGTFEKCVEAKSYSGTEQAVCSSARQLGNTKAVKIVIIPLFFMLLEIAFIAYLVLRCEMKEPAVMICAVVIALSWPFLFCRIWAFGAYNAFLAMLIGCAAGSKDCQKMPWYAYRLFWALAVFQIVALLGPLEAFHVPLFGESKAAANAEFIKNVYDETQCNTYYDSYFTILSIEKQQKEFDPVPTHFGYCSKNWLATVQSFGVVHALLWIGVVLVSGRKLLDLGTGSGSDTAKLIFGEAGKEP